MKSKKIIVGIIICLIAITAIFTCIHLTTRDKVVEGAISVEVDGSTKEVSLDSLSLTKVEGSVVNGKGEEKTVSGDGILVKDLLATLSDSAINEITVVADDEYSAQISGDEISEDAKVYLLIEEGKGNLVVFGDQNSKRNVSNVVKIVVK